MPIWNNTELTFLPLLEKVLRQEGINVKCKHGIKLDLDGYKGSAVEMPNLVTN